MIHINIDNHSETSLANISIILQYIYRNRYTSRIEIANATGLTPAAVTPIVRLLLKEKVLFETGDVDHKMSGSGRRRKILTINKNKGVLFGLEFNMKGFFFSATDICGDTLFNITRDFSLSELMNINQIIIDIFTEAKEKVSDNQVIGGGIAIPGHYDKKSLTIASNNDLWENFNLDVIRNELEFPIVVENNIESMSISEYLFKPINTPEVFSFLHVGPGLFYSYFDSKNIRPNLNYYVGEIGHTVVDINGPECECGKNGCLQTYISESWIFKHAKYLFENSPNTVFHSLVDSKNEITLKTVIDAYNLNDPFMKQYLNHGLELLGISIANSIIIQDTTKILIHSELFENKQFSGPIIDIIENQLQFIPTKERTEVEIVPYDDFRGSVGACAVACLSFLIKDANYYYQ